MIAPANEPENSPVRVMLVDDSAIIRGLYRRMMSEDDGVEVVADAGNGEIAVRRLQDNPLVEVIILDIEMPVMDGVTAIPLLLKARPDVMILMSSTLTTQNANASLRAMRAGAADYLPKPTTSRGLTSGQDFRSELLMKIKILGETLRKKSGNIAPRPVPGKTPVTPVAKPETKASGWRLRSSSSIQLRNPGRHRPRVIAIGSSTGGPEALREIFETMPLDINLPIVITQHMPPMFTKILADRLGRSGAWTVREAEDGDELKPGVALVAPGGRHMLFKQQGTRIFAKLDDGPPENFCRPAVDPMFRSVNKLFGGAVLGVVLTGMGDDGTKGAKEIIDTGGTIVAQNEETSVVWGMPGAVTGAGLCSKLIPRNEMAKYITNFVVRFAK